MEAVPDLAMFHFAHLKRRTAGLLCGTVLFMGGCGSSLESTVTGTLTHGGKAVPLAQIVFHPAAGGPLPYAVTEDDGSYSVLTASDEGLKAGAYSVVVQAMAPGVSLPDVYGSVATSPLKYEIKPGKNVFDIDLK